MIVDRILETAAHGLPRKDYRRATADFAVAMRDAKKILAIEIAGLGDLVHSLPALWAVRQACPWARLHCLVRDANASLLKLTPWIDRVIPYRRDVRAPLHYQLAMIRTLRAEHYDFSVELMGNDYSCLAGWVGGARRRLVRNPGASRSRHAWRLFGTEVMESEFRQEPAYAQKLRCVSQAGFTTSRPVFELTSNADARARLGIEVSAAGRYIHISPYTKLAGKELPPSEMLRLMSRLAQEFPDHRLALSCSGAARELAALNALLASLPFKPWKVFRGTLDIPGLYAVLEGASLHLGGDSGALHLAWLANTPSVSWFRGFGEFSAWVPQGGHHAIVVSDDPRTDFLHGIDGDSLIAQMRSGLAHRHPA